MRRTQSIALLAILIGMPVVLALALGNPIPSHIPPISHIAHALSTHIPTGVWVHLMTYILWLVWLWLLLGFIVQVAQHVLHTIPRRVPFLGVSQDIAQQIIELVYVSSLPREVKAREARLRGVVQAPRDQTLDERAQMWQAERATGQAPKELLRYGKLPHELLPKGYRNNPVVVWWLDTAIRHLARYYAEMGRAVPPIQRVKVSDVVSVWLDTADDPPDPWDTLVIIEGWWTLNLVDPIARRISSAVHQQTDVLSHLIPVGVDERGLVEWTWNGTSSLAVERKFNLTEQAQWLALVPWLDQILIYTVGSWEHHLAPAHQHFSDQMGLWTHLRGTERDERTIIVLTDTPCLPTSPFENEYKLVWVGPEWPLEHPIKIVPNANGKPPNTLTYQALGGAYEKARAQPRKGE